MSFDFVSLRPLLCTYQYSRINLGGQTNQVDPHATGANPGFRTSVASFLTNELWADGTSSSTINQQVQQLKQNTQTIDPISTNSAAYMNQVCSHLL